MSSPAPTATTPIDRLRARISRLAMDPRARLLPDGPAILVELDGLVCAVDDLARRVAAIERGLAGLVPPAVEFE